MAKSARTYVFESQERIPDVLRPFVETRVKAALGERWLDEPGPVPNCITDHGALAQNN